jgi:hypothetical protein
MCERKGTVPKRECASTEDVGTSSLRNPNIQVLCETQVQGIAKN